MLNIDYLSSICKNSNDKEGERKLTCLQSKYPEQARTEKNIRNTMTCPGIAQDGEH
jgi:hypothetical protein